MRMLLWKRVEITGQRENVYKVAATILIQNYKTWILINQSRNKDIKCKVLGVLNKKMQIEEKPFERTAWMFRRYDNDTLLQKNREQR